MIRGLLVVLLLGVLAGCGASSDVPDWTEQEARLIASMSLSSLPPLPADPSNAVADNPAAAELGRSLFFDTRLSGNGKVACASCHLPDRQFQDDLPLAKGVGTTTRRTMPIVGTAYSPWQFWDGRKDSQWAQALGPLESPVEHGTNRARVAHVVAATYADTYESVFGALPELATVPLDAAPAGSDETVANWATLTERQQHDINVVFSNVGKAIAAFERTIMPEPSRFDTYADAVAEGEVTEGLLTREEVAGLKFFIGKGNCTNCHNGPLLTDNFFHNTGVPAVAELPDDTGRALGALQVLEDPFNCLGEYSDADPGACAELRYMTAEGHELERAYKPPTLRGVSNRAPFMHAGQFATLREVLEHYNRAPDAPSGHSELQPLAMSEGEFEALEAFLATLSP